jgi:hypothetical protein
MKHTTTIQGIPCQVEVTYYAASRGARERGTGLQLEPDEPAFWDIMGVYDRKGYQARWLARKMTDEDIERIQGELGE